MSLFKLHAPFPSAGDQKQAIDTLTKHRPGISTLLGVTGSGKTYTIAQAIAQQDKPVVVVSPNKTLAAQLYEEFSQFFPDNKVCYFVSYYDYYQPESYLPAQDVYIPKETKVNSEVERLRVEATAAAVERRDTIIVTSVSCIYSLGNPWDYRKLALTLTRGQQMPRRDLLRHLLFIQYERNDMDKRPGAFQVYGATVEVHLPYYKDAKLRIELFGSEIEDMQWVDAHNNTLIQHIDHIDILPAKHFVTTEDKKYSAIDSIQAELDEWLPQLKNPVYRQRLESRVKHDLDLLQEHGTCPGIENYSVHFDGRATGEPPYCLFDFFDDCLMIVDESHIAVPQLRGMYAGDQARKQSLVDYGFRLPSALDNRPLEFSEIEQHFKDVVFVSATPGEYELTTSDTQVEQIIRPTGLVDPEIEIRPRKHQIDDLIAEIRSTNEKGYRTLVTVLTKRMAEELAHHLEEQQIKVCYLHHDLKTPQRTQLLHKLRLGVFDCLIGVNLLREGLDLPEVARVAIMDADVESFLRDKRSLIQTIGRAARNSESKVLLYGDRVTQSMRAAIDETERRRAIQKAHNEQHGITPQTVERTVTKSISKLQHDIEQASQQSNKRRKTSQQQDDTISTQQRIDELEQQMQQAADNYEFEKAIELRREWDTLKKSQQTSS